MRKRTQVDDIVLEMGLEPRLVNLERINVLSVVVTLDVDGDLGSPIDAAYVLAPNLAPLGVEFLVEGLQCADILLHFGQLSLLDLHVRHPVRTPDPHPPTAAPTPQSP